MKAKLLIVAAVVSMLSAVAVFYGCGQSGSEPTLSTITGDVKN